MARANRSEGVLGRRLGVRKGLEDQLDRFCKLLPGDRPARRLSRAVERVVLREDLVPELISELLK
eukprot:10469488-Alexandrium_andersonii.AAC.1